MENEENIIDLEELKKKNLNKNGLLYIEGPLERNLSFVFFTINVF